MHFSLDPGSDPPGSIRTRCRRWAIQIAFPFWLPLTDDQSLRFLKEVTLAVWFIRQIRQLYRLEDQLRTLDSAERYHLRQEPAPDIWEAMKRRAGELEPKLLPKSTLGKAVNYFLSEYNALVGYLQDGRFEIDNNLVENDIRPTAVGRKRWLVPLQCPMVIPSRPARLLFEVIP